ncbi:MAG: component of the chromatin assembly complex, partial [Linnemannia gamsii]
MRVKPLQIHWHDKQPIYSAHFEPGPKGRLATAGGDGNVRLWKVVKDKEKDSTHIEFLSSLNRHTAAVNVVRFSPTAECLASAGDDGNIILWRPTENKEVVSRFAESDDEEFERETWRVQSMMRGSLSDIYDIAWSPDGRFIISGSIDNTARIWDVKDAKCIHVIADHRHYVQGVAWDPLGDFVATQSSDRSVHIYGFKIDKNGHVVVNNLGKSTKLDLTKLRSMPQPAVPVTTVATPSLASNSAQTKATGDTDMAVDSSTEKEDTSKPATRTPKTFRLYHDETLTSFFRRLSFTPDGSMLITPAGQYRVSIQKTGPQRDEESSTTPQASELEMRNTAYIYARRDFGRGPVAHLPGHKKPSVAIKCSPVLYELRPIQPAGPSSSYHRSTATSAPSTATSSTADATATTQENAAAPRAPSVFGLGYRSIFAVATQDSILIYDTQQSAALALVSHLHYATFTDMAWSSDGCNLILTSSDGFCSIISFEEGELGTVYTPPKSMMALLPAPDSTLASPKEPKAKAKQEKSESAGTPKKSTTKKAAGKTQTTLSTPAMPGATAGKVASASASAVTTATQSPASASPADSPKTSFKTERDGDSVMSIASEQPTPKKRRIQPTFVSALPGSADPAP